MHAPRDGTLRSPNPQQIIERLCDRRVQLYDHIQTIAFRGGIHARAELRTPRPQAKKRSYRQGQQRQAGQLWASGEISEEREADKPPGVHQL